MSGLLFKTASPGLMPLACAEDVKKATGLTLRITSVSVVKLLDVKDVRCLLMATLETVLIVKMTGQ